MIAIFFAIAFTTGVCAFLFFVLPWMDARNSQSDDPNE